MKRLIVSHLAVAIVSAASAGTLVYRDYHRPFLETRAALDRCGTALDANLARVDALAELLDPKIPSPIEHVPLDENFADGPAPISHNQYGGYIPACGDKPGLVGDDC